MSIIKSIFCRANRKKAALQASSPLIFRAKIESFYHRVYTETSTVTMFVQKRGDRGLEEVKFDKITERIKLLCRGLSPVVDATKVALSTINSLYNGIPTEELDMISAKTAEQYKLIHPDYGTLAARVCISNLHKSTPHRFSECMERIGKELYVKSDEHYQFIAANAERLDAMIVHENDYTLDYFGFKTLDYGYLVKINGKTCDRPQYMYMRVAIALYKDSNRDANKALDNIKACYKLFSHGYFTHATPTLFNSCTKYQQLNSCFLLGTGDSIESIMKNASDCAFISKWAGGIGVHMHNIRANGTIIRSTGGRSSGLPRQLKIYNEVARTFDQGGKRLGAIAVYLEMWHGDIMQFLKMKLQNGAPEERARDLFYALWVCDLFVKRVRNDEPWSLFSEDTAPGLSDVYDGMEQCTICDKYREHAGAECAHVWRRVDAFTELYTRYEREGRALRKVSARDVLDAVFTMQRESGTPYICFKDRVNRKSNQANLGTIKSSNLCAEIVQWSNDKSYACCTLASINLRKYLVEDGTRADGSTKYSFSFNKLHEVTRLVARNLDIIIDVNKYPVKECGDNSYAYRPIGIGIQALADIFCIMRIPFLSAEAERLDVAIAETIYHAALTESCERAKQLGAYSAFRGSPASEGRLQHDLWLEETARNSSKLELPATRLDWDPLRADIKTHGVRNSLVVAYMPTVTTSQILGNNESFEPYNSNIYTKTTLAGKFTVSNTTMIRHLSDLGIWNESIKNRIVSNNGSVQDIEEIPRDVREIYKTVWELPQRQLMRRAALRSAYVDQAISLNIHVNDNSTDVLRAIFMEGYDLMLKTGSYYIRTKPAAKAIKNVDVKADIPVETDTDDVCYAGKEGCTSCAL